MLCILVWAFNLGTVTNAYQYQPYNAMGDCQCKLHQMFWWEMSNWIAKQFPTTMNGWG
jgi:hypothetical protein